MKKRGIFYKKLMINYNVVIITFIVVINLFLLRYVKQQELTYNKQINNRMVSNISTSLKNMDNFVSSFMMDLYSDEDILEDTRYFLESDLETYIKNKLDKFYKSDSSYYKGFEFFIKNSFAKNDFLESIEVISYKTNKSYLFNLEGGIKINEIKDINKNFSENNNIVYTRNIHNPLNLEVEGSIMFKFDKRNIDKIVNNYGQMFRALVVKKNGLILYDSENEKREDTNFIDITKLLTTHKENIAISDTKNNLIVFGLVKDVSIFQKNKKLILYLVIINALFFITSEILIFNKLKKLNNRLNIILDTMDSINLDDKLKRIPENVLKEKDEIAIICKNFNNMCESLEDYIEKYYISTINEKNAEMKNLQNIINPHFLYNTLESIRMKAIINNDKEVAKMIYLLAHIFRSQVKEDDIITIKSELEYCKKFLEIYKFRYEDKITYNIKYDEQLLGSSIIKFIIQPIIENYFIHGVRLEKNNNFVCIDVFREENYIKIVISDNGKGIEAKKLQELNNKIQNNENDNKMVGILNVNQRIKMHYGNEYGILIESDEDKGTKVTINLPYFEER